MILLRPLLLVALLPLGRLTAASRQPRPKEVVAQFLALDTAGARLRSSPGDPIWKLTKIDGEPPAQPIILVKECHPLKAAANRVYVSCTVLGTVKDDGISMVYLPHQGQVSAFFTLLKADDTLKISLNSLHFPPHVTPAALQQHLDTLVHLYDAEKDKADPRFNSLLRLQKTLQRANLSR